MSELEPRQAMFEAIRTELTECATMTAIVASNSITVSLQRPPTTYPAIRMRIVAGTGRTFNTRLAGDLYLNVYTNDDAYAAALASTYNIVFAKLHDQQANLTNSNIGVGIFKEEFVDYPQYEEDAGIYYLAARYSFVAQTK